LISRHSFSVKTFHPSHKCKVTRIPTRYRFVSECAMKCHIQFYIVSTDSEVFHRLAEPQ